MEEIYMVADSYGETPPNIKKYYYCGPYLSRQNLGNRNGANVEMERNNISMIEKSKAVHTPEALNCLGVAYAKNKQYDKAKETLKRATDAGNRRPRSIWNN